MNYRQDKCSNARDLQKKNPEEMLTPGKAHLHSGITGIDFSPAEGHQMLLMKQRELK
jgi:hypothetical protein